MKEMKDASHLAQVIKTGQVTPRQAVEYSLGQIKELNRTYLAVHHLFEEEALERADEMTDFSAPFAGVPIVIKDLGQAYRGGRSTSGSSLLKDAFFEGTNHFVQHIEKAGFIIIGQTNVPEFGVKFISDSAYLGTVKNGVQEEYHAGGSSGGAATAIQTGMVTIATASDGGGSIRIPASFQGLIGLKPSTGRMPMGPGTWRSWGGGSTNFALTQSMRDTESLFMEMQTFDYPAMPFRLPTLEKTQIEESAKSIKDAKIAYSINKDLDSKEAQLAMTNHVSWLKDQGFEAVEDQPSIDNKALVKSYYKMNGIELDKILSGIEAGRGQAIQEDEVELTTWALKKYGKKTSGADYSRLFDQWDAAAEALANFHLKYDLYLHPTTTGPAPSLADKVYDLGPLEGKDLEGMTQADLEEVIWQAFKPANQLSPYAVVENLTGNPALSLPLHTCASGLPLGLQYSAGKGREDLLLGIGHYIEDSGILQGPCEA